MSNPTLRSLSVHAECFADGHVYNQTPGSVRVGRVGCCPVCLRELIGKVRWGWLKATLSISNPNGRRDCQVNDGERRDSGEWRMTTNGQRLMPCENSPSLSAVASSSNADRRSKTNYTARWHGQGVRALSIYWPWRGRAETNMCIVTYCFHYELNLHAIAVVRRISNISNTQKSK